MALVNLPVPNLISGVSQQPPTLRLTTAAQAMDNAWPSVISGLNKRPPTEHIAKIAGINPASIAGHIIDRQDDYHYIVTIHEGTLKVFDMDGNEQTVNMPNGNAYLAQAANPLDDFRFVTIQDTTFILNRNVSVYADEYGEDQTSTYIPDGTVTDYSNLPTADVSLEGKVYLETRTGTYYQCTEQVAQPEVRSWVYTGQITASTSSPPSPSGPLPASTGGMAVGTYWYVFAGQGSAGTQQWSRYQVQVTQPASGITYTWEKTRVIDLVPDTPNRKSWKSRATIFVTTSVANSNYSVYLNNSLVANYTTPAGVDAGSSVPGTPQIAQKIVDALTLNGVTCSIEGSTICITGLTETDTIKTTATQGDKAMRVYRYDIPSFSDLPPRETNGRIVRVKGSAKENADDYYVVFQNGIWTETYGYGEGARIRADTMPHVLIREADGSWTFKQHKWPSRNAGDAESNPLPSFVGERFKDIYLFTNRLGFLTDSNIILSEASIFENFFRTTLATLVDSDRIDVAVVSSLNDHLRHAVAFNKDVLILGDRSQHRLTYNQFVGPKNVQIQFTTAFNCAPNVRPVNMGGSVYFVDDKTGYSYGKVYEYFPKPNLAGDDAEETTAPVPQYIKSGLRFIGGSPRLSVMVAGSDGDPTRLYLHKFFWSGDRKVQNSWSTWTFPDVVKVHWAGFSRNYIILLMQRSDGFYIERIRVDEDLYDYAAGSRVMLDRLANPTAMTYDAATNSTIITLPYSTDAAVDVVRDHLGVKLWYRTDKISSNQVSVGGDITDSTLWVGVPYTFSFTFSQPYLRFPKGQGEVVALDGRLQMRYMTLEYHDTPFFKVSVKVANRDPHVRTVDQAVQSGKHRIALLGSNTDLELSLSNESPFNSSFGLAEWYAIYAPKAKRV